MGTRIHLCGPLRIHLAGQPREGLLHGRQGRLLFAFLVFRRHRPVTRDALVQALWGEEGIPPSEGALAPVLSRLRRAVAPATVDGRDGIHLSLPQPAYIDVEAAEAALRRARSSPGAEERLAGAQEAATIVEAGLLPGLEAPWLEQERAGLERLRTEALELGAEAATSIEPPLAESLARAAVTGAPFRESAWAALITALRARGNVAEALQVYDEVRRLLRDELGTVPGRQLLALHRALVAESDERPSDRRAAPHPRRLELAADLVERDDELKAIDAALARLVAGEGGLVLARSRRRATGRAARHAPRGTSTPSGRLRSCGTIITSSRSGSGR